MDDKKTDLSVNFLFGLQKSHNEPSCLRFSLYPQPCRLSRRWCCCWQRVSILKIYQTRCHTLRHYLRLLYAVWIRISIKQSTHPFYRPLAVLEWWLWPLLRPSKMPRLLPTSPLSARWWSAVASLLLVLSSKQSILNYFGFIIYSYSFWNHLMAAKKNVGTRRQHWYYPLFSPVVCIFCSALVLRIC